MSTQARHDGDAIVQKFNPIIRHNNSTIVQTSCVTEIDNDLILNIDDEVIQNGRRACAVRGAQPLPILLQNSSRIFVNLE